ncbi:glycosyltransferase family 4 protein [Flavobacterium pectinovorum]|uniref:glycosyltransferase family 4 protein n=1 Tax=Flavobacterium pectinovorum TaxID=29533 RepID=UPI001FAC3B6B|nr:glycosyltransferase family 4 protein [Flavobacterium pectinovorum]MCI9845894.1 glycosyltransferase family 4 protein [Flavobacterium pectinovorum]
MKILFITPKINNQGGVARVLSLRSNYFIQNKNYQIHILTQNSRNFPLFFDFDKRIVLHDMSLLGNPIKFLLSYRKGLNELVAKINPDVIFVLDNGLKSYLLPYFLKTTIPLILEIHGSKYVQEKKVTNKLFDFFSIKIKEIGIKRYTKVIFLSNESALEWNYKKPIIISNPISFLTNDFSNLSSKKAIVVARHSYEKGLDRMLNIWKRIIEKYPDWNLEIYGKSNENQDLQEMVNSLGIGSNVTFFEPVKNILEKYLNSSLFLMTSRSEGFPMVLLEAMALGLPVVAYDCPCGPRAIIKNGENGFLVEDSNADSFVEKLELLMNDENLRIQMGLSARESVKKYNLENIMVQWKTLFEEMDSEI